MRRRTHVSVPLRCLPLALLCAAALAACGSSVQTTSRSAPAATATTVTRTVTGSGPATTSATTTATATQTQTAASIPRCVAAGLALESLGGSAATGHALLAFSLRNTTSHRCATGGYPGVLFLDAAGRGLPTVPDHTTADFFGQTVLRPLVVAPGGVVSFRLGVSDVSSGDSSAGCVSAKGVQVIAPDDTATLRLTRAVYECGGKVSVSPLQAGVAALH
jgi:hypothetical protein